MDMPDLFVVRGDVHEYQGMAQRFAVFMLEASPIFNMDLVILIPLQPASRNKVRAIKAVSLILNMVYRL